VLKAGSGALLVLEPRQIRKEAAVRDRLRGVAGSPGRSGMFIWACKYYRSSAVWYFLNPESGIRNQKTGVFTLADNNYLVFTRKWRPQTFEEILGQEQVTVSLKRAIETGRIMHAYLFSGPRGVGKTTTARVFAKALNCEKGPTSHPCNQCSMCKETMNGSSLDVIEIDGASNSGVENIRELREHVGFSATKSKYKIYIIDEVHMLSKEAFNAFLKTLEEPPSHVIFIFATTDTTKIPQTILSRCQHFRFRRMPASFMIENLKMIAEKENIKYEEEALFAISKAADGAMRDAQRIFDQSVTYAKGEPLTGKLASEMLGEIGTETLNRLIASIAAKDIKLSIVIVEEVFSMGFDLKHFLRDFIELLRDMMVIKTTGAREMAAIGDDEYTYLKKTGEMLEKREILYILQKAIEVSIQLERTNTPDIALETFIMDVILNSGALTEPSGPAVQPQKEAAKETPSLSVAPVTKEESPEGHIMIESIEEKEVITKLTKEIIEKRWENIVEKSRADKERADLAQALETAGIVAFEDMSLFLVGENPFMTKILAGNKEAVRAMLKEEFETVVTLIIQDKEDYRKKYQVKKNVDEEEAKNHPLVKDLGKIFKITEIDIKKAGK
jgi:DNA polymerase-3 subunit gamma/tau